MGRKQSKKSSPLHANQICRCSVRSHYASKKPYITANRVTLLPDFLTRSKSWSSSSGSPENANNVVNPPKLRRSWRLCKKNQPVTVSGYFNKLVSEENKSIFKDIKSKYRTRFERKQGTTDDDFEEKLLKQLNNVQLRDRSYYKSKILEDIERINNTVIVNKKNMSGNRKRAYNDEEKETYPMKFPYIPQSKWVFQTPPNRKLNFRNVNSDSGIEPAVIETRNNAKVVYEMNKKINVDLSGFNNRQEIDIDKRFMVEVGNCVTGDVDGSDVNEEKLCTLDFLPPDPFELENHFLSLTCRPKKVTSTVSRISKVHRKRDIFLDPQPGCSTDADYKPNTFLDSVDLNDVEESFTFKFTSSESTGSSTTGHLFDFEGNKKNTFNFRF